MIHKNFDCSYAKATDRIKMSRSDEVLNSGNTGVFELVADTFAGEIGLKTLTHALTYYDGAAFSGKPYGEIGIYGMPVRTETLAVTPEELTAAYGAGNIPPAFSEGATPNWNAYPNAFVNALQDPYLGYAYKNTAPYQTGYYTCTEKRKYDFQVSPTTARGQVVAMRDSYNNEATVAYDSYRLLPETVTLPGGMQTSAEYDYRIMQVYKVTDANANITQYAFSPLGLMTKTALLAKGDGTEGDTMEDPSVRLEYDFFAFLNEGKPIWVKTIQRENHIHASYINTLPPDEQNATIISAEYSDGFGRQLQTRTQAEDVIFGNSHLGDSGLPTDQSAPNANAVGVERSSGDPLNVVVSGWKMYNNKGEVIEQYEPFYSKGFDYGEEETKYGSKIRMFYDPVGRLIKTLMADGSREEVIYGIPAALSTPNNFAPTPWERYTYSPNDLGGGVHKDTPKSETIDALGNVIKTTEHAAFDNDGSIEDVVMQYDYDIKGQLLEVFDPYDRSIFQYTYDTSGKRLRTYHLDSGVKTVVIDALNLPMITQDAKGAGSLFSYDHLLRPVFIRSRDGNSQPITLRQVLRYGDSSSLTNPEDKNLNGQLYQHFDEAGKLTYTDYDFSGNLLSKKRNVIDDAALKSIFINPPSNWKVAPFTVDWSLGTSILDPQVFQTDMEYDALGRVRKMLYPKNVDNNRELLVPSYNNAGTLASLVFDGQHCVENIAYNAKGQRILIAYGNEIMTRYTYNPLNFRLLRYRSERFARSANEGTITYSPQAGTGRQDRVYSYDPEGNILATEDHVTDCGITKSPEGPDKLIRQFGYDPLNRLLVATGRESNTQAASYLYNDAPVPAAPNAKHTRAYSRNYAYDKVGNVQLLDHKADSNSFLRVFDYNSGYNTVADIKNGQGNLLSDFKYDANGNTILAGSSRNMIWDAGDQLKAYYNQTGTTEPTVYAQYLYDASGNRIKKLVRTQGGSFETVVYIDGIFEYHKKDGEGEKNQLHILDGQSRIASVRIGTAFSDDLPEKQFYVLEDHLGSSCLRVKASPGGTVIDREEYYPFGDSSLRTFTKKSYRYCGKEKDSESGLYYYGARYYAPCTCRFVSVDPLAEKYAHLNPYNYASNSPITHKDVDGNQNPSESATPQGGGSKPVKKGDKFVGDDGKTYTASIDEVVITGTKSPTATGNQETKTEAAENLKPTSFTFTLDYEANSSNIPFIESYRHATGTFTNVLETGEVSDFVEGDTGGGFNVKLKVPEIYPHNRDNPTYTTYTGTGSDLENLNWEKEQSLAQSFIDGFNAGWKVGLSTAIQEELATAILFKRFNLSNAKSFEGADPELLRLFFKKKGWRVNPTNNGGFRAINPENSSDVFHIIRGNASKLKPGTNIPKVKQGDYLKRPYMDSWPKRTPLK